MHEWVGDDIPHVLYEDVEKTVEKDVDMNISLLWSISPTKRV